MKTKNPRCEVCRRSAGANYYSDERCDRLELGAVLCPACAFGLDGFLPRPLSDAEYVAAFEKHLAPTFDPSFLAEIRRTK